MTDKKPFDVLPIDEVLRKICSSSQRPLMMLYLTSGNYIKGAPLGLHEAANRATLQLMTGTNGESIVYLSVSSIIALEICDAAEVSGILSDGPLYRASDDEPLTLLELKRQTEAIANHSSLKITVDWANFKLDSRDARFDYEDLLEALDEALKKIRIDDMGVKALQGVSEIFIELGQGEFLETHLTYSKIHILRNPNKRISGNLKEIMIQAIQRVL